MKYPFNPYKTRCKTDPIPHRTIWTSLNTTFILAHSLFRKWFSLDDSFGKQLFDERQNISRREINGERCKRKSPAWDACNTTTVRRIARSLKSNDLAHFTDFYPLSQRPVRRTAWTHLYRCRVGGADDAEYDDDDEPFYRIRRRGLFRWGGFRRALVRRTNWLVWSHRHDARRGRWGKDPRRGRDYEDDSIFDIFL